MSELEKDLILGSQQDEAGVLRRLAGADQGNPTCTATHTVHELTGSTSLIDMICTPDEKAETLEYLKQHGRFWDD